MAKTTKTAVATTSPPSGGGDAVRALKRAAKRRAEAEARYAEALQAAVDEVGYAEAARAIGVSRQSVRQLLLYRR